MRLSRSIETRSYPLRPSLAIVLFGLGLMERDGAAILAGGVVLVVRGRQRERALVGLQLLRLLETTHVFSS
jgi:hypothetical protein